MGETTQIGWTEATYNPWYGCRRVSPGCDNCYAERGMTRFGKDFSKVQRASSATFYAPLRWKEPRRIFVCSWSDFFVERDIDDEWRIEAWNIMKATPQHTYQVLTKRPGRMAAWAERYGWPNHIWAGTSVESSKYLPRLNLLARVPAKIRFVSCEPLLGPLDLRPWLDFKDLDAMPLEWRQIWKGWTTNGPYISWVICGGESGASYRPMNLAWMQDIADQCATARVPLFVKQDSGPRPGMQGRIPDALWGLKEMP